ncbi:hypothetical protein J6590_085936 [Homalodisca vitripennis]|nr:hypothetical protein J6590_085936 [Homalodisca vitripennis]
MLLARCEGRCAVESYDLLAQLSAMFRSSRFKWRFYVTITIIGQVGAQSSTLTIIIPVISASNSEP